MARIGTVTKFCKKHKDYAEHGVYQYGDTIIERCLECAREQRKARRNDPEKYEHDKSYTSLWASENREYVRDQARLNHLKNKVEKRFNVNQFLADQHAEVKWLLKHYDNPMTFEQISSWCMRHGIVHLIEIRERIARTRRSQLYNAEVWKQSVLVKYHNGVLGNYAEIPETFKETIRAESKVNALKAVNKKMEEYA